MVIGFVPWGCGTPSKWPFYGLLIGFTSLLSTYDTWDDPPSRSPPNFLPPKIHRTKTLAASSRGFRHEELFGRVAVVLRTNVPLTEVSGAEADGCFSGGDG